MSKLYAFGCHYNCPNGYHGTDTDITIAASYVEAHELYTAVYGKGNYELFERVEMSNEDIEQELHRQMVGGMLWMTIK